MADKVKNQIVVIEPSTPSVTELLKLVREKDLAEVITCATPDEAIQNISGALPCLLITSLTDNSVVPLRVQLLKRLEGVIKQGALKVYMVTGMKNRQLADLFTQKLGVTDYIIDPVPARTMFFKVNLALKAVDNFRKIAEQKKAASEQIVIKKMEAKKAEAAAAGGAVPAKGKPALQMAEDTFLFKNGGVKKAGKKFVVEVEGPDPSTGEWKQHEDKGDAQAAWRWVPNEEKAAQEAGKAPPDGWVHTGDKPAFNEETGKWALASEKPQLALKKAGQVVAEKVGLDEKGEVVVAEDSPAAEANVQKNREKAAVAIKAREESRKATLALKAQENKDRDPKKPEAKAEETKKPGDLSKEKPALAGKDPKEENKGAQPKAKMSLADQLGGGDGEDSDWQEDKGEFNNKTGGKKDQLRSVTDKRDGKNGEFGAALRPGAGTELASGNDGADAAGKPKSPLDFLKQKREKLEKDGGKARPESDDLYAEGLEESGEAEAAAPGSPASKAEKKKKAASPDDKLARLRAGLAESDDQDSPEGWQEEKGEFNNNTGGKKEQLRSAVDKRGGKSQEFGAALKKGAGLELALGDKDAEPAAADPRPELALKKSALAKMKERLEAPVPDTMSPAEEEEARKALGLQNRPEIKVKELAKRKRDAEMARMKALVAEIEEDEQRTEEEGGEVLSNNLRSKADGKDAPTRTHDLSAEKLKGIRAAIDGEELGEFGEQAEERRRAGGEKNEPKGKSMVGEDKAFYLPEAKLQPKGNAWESAGAWYAYLGAEVRYKGFDKIEDVLPLWVFKGDRVPELLTKAKQWRFFGGMPVQAKTVAEIPAEVRDFLLGIRETLAANAQSKKEQRESDPPAARKEKTKASGGDLLDKLKDRLGDGLSAEDGELVEEADADGGPETSKAGKKRSAGGHDALEALKAELEDERPAQRTDESVPGDPAPGGAQSRKDSGAAGLDALNRLKQKMNRGPGSASVEAAPDAAANEETEKDSSPAAALERLRKKMEAEPAAPGEEAAPETETPPPEREVDPSEYFGRPKKKEEKQESARSAIDRLREQLGDEEQIDANDSAGPAKDPADGSKGLDALKRLREKMQQGEELPGAEPPADAAGETKDELAEEIQSLAKEQSQFGGDRNEAMRRLREKLLDNQAGGETAESTPEPEGKEKSAAPVPVLSKEQSDGVKRFLERRKAKLRAIEKSAQTARPGGPPISVYLGLFVAVSDALGLDRAASSLPRVLQGFEDSFGNCRAFVVENPGGQGMAKVSYFAGENAPAEDHFKLDSGIAEAISRADGGGTEVVGYLFLRPSGDRKEFSEGELQAMRRVAAMLWPILARASGAEKKAA